jgi:hypothetical protein
MEIQRIAGTAAQAGLMHIERVGAFTLACADLIAVALIVNFVLR